jgi:hypothetical protein
MRSVGNPLDLTVAACFPGGIYSIYLGQGARIVDFVLQLATIVCETGSVYPAPLYLLVRRLSLPSP